MSSLLRGDTLVSIDRPAGGAGAVPPRIFGTRVLRSEHVGIQHPFSLAAPLNNAAFDSLDGVFDQDVALAAPPAADLGAIEEAARLRGFSVGAEQGRAVGVAAAEQAMAESVSRLAALASNAHESHAAFFRSAERQVVDLALQIAQKVVEREIENIPDLAVNVIRAALEEMDARTAVRVRVSPEDEELLRRRWSQIVPSSVGAERVELQKDERVQAGGAIIETTHGEVDAQLNSKLAQLGNVLWTFSMDVNSGQQQQESVDA